MKRPVSPDLLHPTDKDQKDNALDRARTQSLADTDRALREATPLSP
jgi:hypothetical protein